MLHASTAECRVLLKVWVFVFFVVFFEEQPAKLIKQNLPILSPHPHYYRLNEVLFEYQTKGFKRRNKKIRTDNPLKTHFA